MPIRYTLHVPQNHPLPWVGEAVNEVERVAPSRLAGVNWVRGLALKPATGSYLEERLGNIQPQTEMIA